MRAPPFGLVAASLILAACSSSSSSGGGDAAVTATPWAPAFDATNVGWLLSTCGSGPTDLYAVGGSTPKAAVMHYDGAAWSKVALGLDAPLLNWCHAFAPDDVTIVGDGGTVIHFDGRAWSKRATPTTQDLWGVWGASPDDVWAVGGDGMAAGHATLLHWDGAAWAAVALPTLQKADVFQLLKVWGTGADDVYVVGQRGVVLHKKGATWSEELVGASDDLVSLWGTGPDRIVAVGGRANGIASVWDGTAWKTTELAPTPGLNGVWMRVPGKAHVAGAYGTLGVLDLGTMALEVADVGEQKLDFHSVRGDASGHLWAVGGNLGSAHPATYTGIAFGRRLGSDE
jgi:hypothetical protein